MKRTASSAWPRSWVLALWVLLWGNLSVANVVSGAVVVALVVLAIPDVGLGFTRPTIRPLWALRFTARVLIGLGGAVLVVGVEVLAPRPRINTGIVAVPLPTAPTRCSPWWPTCWAWPPAPCRSRSPGTRR